MNNKNIASNGVSCQKHTQKKTYYILFSFVFVKMHHQTNKINRLSRAHLNLKRYVLHLFQTSFAKISHSNWHLTVRMTTTLFPQIDSSVTLIQQKEVLHLFTALFVEKLYIQIAVNKWKRPSWIYWKIVSSNYLLFVDSELFGVLFLSHSYWILIDFDFFFKLKYFGFQKYAPPIISL